MFILYKINIYLAMSNIQNETPWVESLESREEGKKLLLEYLDMEIWVLTEDLQARNPNIAKDEIYQRYISTLRYIWDPYIQFIDDLYHKRIPKAGADQALEILESRKNSRVYILQCLKNEENENIALWIPVETGTKLRESCIYFHKNQKEITELISVKQRKVLDTIIYGLVLWKIWLLTGELIPEYAPKIHDFYDSLEELSQWILSGDHTIAITLVSVFWYEAYVKIKEVWFVTYVKHNKWDFALNILWWIEIWTIWKEIVTWEVYPWIASALRSLRALRILQMMWKFKGVREIYDSITEASPWVAKITGIYWAVSLVVMIMLTQLTKWHIEELSTLWWALNEMRNLFYADGFQDVLSKIEGHEEMDPMSKILASGIANGYQLLSSTFYFAIPTALFADIVNKSWVRIEQITSLTLERVDTALNLLKEIKDKLPDKTDKV